MYHHAKLQKLVTKCPITMDLRHFPPSYVLNYILMMLYHMYQDHTIVQCNLPNQDSQVSALNCPD